MLQMQLGATVNQVLHSGPVAIGKGLGVGFEPVEKGGVFNEGHLHGFGHARPPVADIEGLEKPKIVEHSRRGCKGAEEVLFAPVIHAVFHTNTRIVLRQNRCRNADMTDTPVRNRCRIAHQIQHRPTADTHYIGMTINAIAIHCINNSLN